MSFTDTFNDFRQPNMATRFRQESIGQFGPLLSLDGHFKRCFLSDLVQIGSEMDSYEKSCQAIDLNFQNYQSDVTLKLLLGNPSPLPEYLEEINTMKSSQDE